MLKRHLNNKIKYIRLILKTHRNHKWDHFLNALDVQNGLIFKLSKRLLNKTPEIHSLIGPTGLIYKPESKAEMFADTYEKQFMPNLGSDLPEVIDFIHFHRSTTPTNCYTSTGTIRQIINKLPKRKALNEDLITNTVIKLLPQKTVMLLTYIISGYFRIGHFSTLWKYVIIITIPKPEKNHRHPVNNRPIVLLSSLSKFFERVILA